MDIRNAAVAPVASAARIAIIIFGCLQGVSLYLVHRYVGDGTTYDILDIWAVPALGFFGLLMFLLTELRDPRPWIAAAAYAILLLLLAVYVDSQCGDSTERGCAFGSIFEFTASQFIAWFILLFFMQSRFDPTQPGRTYGSLLNNSWHNFLTIGLTGLFVGLFWALLVLLASLFNVLGIDFFERLFARNGFYMPVTGLMTGVGVSIFRSQINAVAIVRRILHASIKVLLPLLALIALLFVLALPFTGLQPLWDTGRSAALMMWLTALLLFFVNAVMQEGSQTLPYPRVLRWFVHFAVLAAIALIALSARALLLRTGQYGWTVERLWGLIVLVILAGYVGVYSAGLLARREQWFSWARPGNIAMAAVIAVVLWLVSSPLLDLRRITVASQLARLESGAVAPEDFDFRHLRFRLGKAGVDAVARLAENEDSYLTAELVGYLEDLLAADYEGQIAGAPKPEDPELLLGHIMLVPGEVEVPADLVTLLESGSQTHGADCASRMSACVLLAADLAPDTDPEFVLFLFDREFTVLTPGAGSVPLADAILMQSIVFRRLAGEWRQAGHVLTSPDVLYGELVPLLERGDYAFPPAMRRDLRIGDRQWIWIAQEPSDPVPTINSRAGATAPDD